MSRSTVANLVARLDADTARFQRQMQQANTQTQRYQQRARAANDSSIRMANGFHRAANAAAVLNGPLNGVSGRLSFISSGMRSVGPAGLAFGVTLGAAAVVTSKAAKASDDYARSQARLESQINATRQSVGLSTDELVRQAEQVARTTLASSADIRNAQSQLLRFTSVTGDEFNRTIRLAQDYAAVTGGDVASAAARMGQLLEAPAESFARLRREGIFVTQSQQDVVTALVRTGETAKAQAELLSILEQRVGGAGQSENIGLAGATDSLGQTWNQMLREIADTTQVTSIAANAINWLDRALTSMRDGIAGSEGAMRYMDETQILRARFDADAAIQDLERQRDEVLKKIEDMLGGRRLDELSIYNPTRIRINNMQAEAMLLRNAQQEQVRMSEMFNSELNRREEEAEQARAKAAEAEAERRKIVESEAAAARAEAEREAQEAELRRRIAQSQNLISTMEVQYASEDEKRAIAHARQLAAIENLYADTEALERMGFDNVQSLREHYRALEIEAYQEQLKEIAEQDEARRRQEIDAANERIEAIERSLATEKEMLAFRRDERLRELEELHESELIETERYLELIEKLHADHDERLRQMQAMQLSNTLGNYSQLFDGISGLSETFAGKQSGLYKAMFAASKGFAIADSTVQIINGIAKAANAPFPQNLGQMAAVGSATAGLVSSIRGTKLAGARANGGPVSRGLYLVGERGPEVLNMSGGSGQITSNENLRSALGGGNEGRHIEQHYHFEALSHDHAVELFARERAAMTDSMLRELEDRGISF